MKSMKVLSVMLLAVFVAACGATVNEATTSKGDHVSFVRDNTDMQNTTAIITRDAEGNLLTEATAVHAGSHPGVGLVGTAIQGGAIAGGAYLFAKNLRPDQTSISNSQGQGQGQKQLQGQYSEGGDATNVTGVNQSLRNSVTTKQLNHQSLRNTNVNANVNSNSAAAAASSSSESGGGSGGCFPPGLC